MIAELIRSLESSDPSPSRAYVISCAEDALLAQAGCFGKRRRVVHAQLRCACLSTRTLEREATPREVRRFLSRRHALVALLTRTRTLVSRGRRSVTRAKRPPQDTTLPRSE